MLKIRKMARDYEKVCFAETRIDADIDDAHIFHAHPSSTLGDVEDPAEQYGGAGGFPGLLQRIGET